MALPLLEKNLVENASKTGPMVHEPLEWGNTAHVEQLLAADEDGFELVVLADCVHWPELFEPLVSTLASLVTSPETQCLMAYEERNAKTEAEFFAMLRAGDKFVVRRLEESEMDPRFYYGSTRMISRLQHNVSITRPAVG